MSDKTTSLEDLPDHIESGRTIGIGGWGSRHKPMALARRLLRSDVEVTLVTLGGPEVGCCAPPARCARSSTNSVFLDSIPLNPHLQAARESANIESDEYDEYDEGMFVAALRAGANRLSFLHTRAGLESDVMTMNPGLKTVALPYDNEVHVAVAAVRMDVSLIHMNRCDEQGKAMWLTDSPDLVLTDGECFLMSDPPPLGGNDATGGVVEGWGAVRLELFSRGRPTRGAKLRCHRSPFSWVATERRRPYSARWSLRAAQVPVGCRASTCLIRSSPCLTRLTPSPLSSITARASSVIDPQSWTATCA